jgi:RHS repeat-associated protein
MTQDVFHAPDARLDPIQPSDWMGSIVDGKTDPSGLQYMRNRYYDAKSGRFTQEDPIGLAGGANLYGFGGGDPVNRTDPFGLCPDIPSLCIPAAVALGRAAVRAASTPLGQRAIEGGSRLAQRLGAEGEEAVASALNLSKNTLVRYGNRIPDFVDEARGFIVEVKNTQYQAYTKQLREMFSAAADGGKQIVLFLRDPNNTRQISAPLRDAIQNLSIKVERIPLP